MSTFLVLSNVIAWIVSALLISALLLIRRVNKQWYNRAKEAEEKLEAIEHKNMVSDMERSSLEWYRGEVTRLNNKCRSICQGIRKLKGRGKYTCESYPMHTF